MLESVLGVLFNGVAYGVLLFLMAGGLSVTMGMMGFVNLAHGAFAMLGGYLAVTLMGAAGWPFLATLPAAFAATAAVSVVAERTLYRRLYRAGELDQVLFTIGLVFMSVAGATFVWGPSQQPVQMPPYLSGQVSLFGFEASAYRLFLIVVSGIVTAALVFGLEHTRFGAQVRAAVDNRRMAYGLGIDVNLVFSATFAVGSGLAGLGGALGINLIGLDPAFPIKNMVYFLLVVSVGGLGSIKGTLVAALLLGICDTAGKYYVPEAGAFTLYAVMVGVLLWRPAGLFGRR
ncbi:branched-chain amino acid ABC transporter permease [Azospirillum sp.]|uniref:branched-chain amino acid ABC transporter permease n=1 Tax=Azospirillum sp. TaxID=34012 RepID=UPI002D45E1C5|nr:branched-chain amino acid ABC transporter permease [Azospirillum sp.]HYD68904.1 branched-chain amino acid ABC transporter permease [Azospirillum sp.]